MCLTRHGSNDTTTAHVEALPLLSHIHHRTLHSLNQYVIPHESPTLHDLKPRNDTKNHQKQINMCNEPGACRHGVSASSDGNAGSRIDHFRTAEGFQRKTLLTGSFTIWSPPPLGGGGDLRGEVGWPDRPRCAHANATSACDLPQPSSSRQRKTRHPALMPDTPT